MSKKNKRPRNPVMKEGAKITGSNKKTSLINTFPPSHM